MDNSKTRQNEHLGVNKMGKNIRKSPLHQPNFANNSSSNNTTTTTNNPNRQQPQPQVYNISKNDFRNIVQQLTGSPSQDPLPRPPQNPPKPQSMRLQKIRPPPLTPINRPHIPSPVQQAPVVQQPPPVAYNNSFVRPGQFGHPSPTFMPPIAPGDSVWCNTAESPISAYVRYLQSSLIDPGLGGNQSLSTLQPAPPQPQAPGQIQNQQPGLLPNPSIPPLPSPRVNGPVPPPPPFPAPQFNGPPLLPSPTSQFLLPSPTGFMSLLSPGSPYPLLSPGIQFTPPLTPNFSFSPLAQSGILGPGPQPPPSPGLLFPMSPSSFFPISSPRWRDP